MNELFSNFPVAGLEIESAYDAVEPMMLQASLARLGVAFVGVYPHLLLSSLDVLFSGFEFVGEQPLTSGDVGSNGFAVFAEALLGSCELSCTEKTSKLGLQDDCFDC